jgi:hypothetical protein
MKRQIQLLLSARGSDLKRKLRRGLKWWQSKKGRDFKKKPT